MRTNDDFVSIRAIWARKILHWWRHYNDIYLRSALNTPIIEITASKSYLGCWYKNPARIAISAKHIEFDPWIDVLDTLRHEMAHQYVDQILKPNNETPHGRAFQVACEHLRCSKDASGDIYDPHSPADPIVERVKKILLLSNSSNEHEAQVAMQKAQQLLIKYNIKLINSDEERQFFRRQMGPVKRRHSSYELWLASIINEFFFVETIWVETYVAKDDRNGTVLELYGTKTNLDMACYVYDYLTALLPVLWADYREKAGEKSNKERQRYWAGLLQGFHSKLSNRRSLMNQYDKKELTLWNGDKRLVQFFLNINPHVSVRRAKGVSHSKAYRAGYDRGLSVEIRHPITSSSSDGFGGYIDRN